MLTDKMVKWLERYGYKAEETVFGVELTDLKGREYVKLEVVDGEFKVATKSSYWDLEEASQFAEELNEAVSLLKVLKEV